MTTFKVNDTFFIFPEGTIPKESFLSAFLTTGIPVKKEKGVILLEDVTLEAMEIVYNYLAKKIVPDPEHINVLEAFNIPIDHSYELASIYEEYLRANMYLEGHEEDEINTDQHYGLVKLTPEMWSKLKIDRPDDSNFLFTQKQLQKQSWDEVQKSLSELKSLFGLGSVFIAGGRIFSALFGTRSTDVDLFVHGVDQKKAEAVINDLFEYVSKSTALPAYPYVIINVSSLVITRTANAITFIKNHRYSTTTEPNARYATREHHNVKEEYQVIFRLYRTPSEILHGFDVDCCSIGYDGENIWLTQRALFALTRGYNTVNFGRLSPSYEYRLVKYGTRGVSIKIPNFDRDKVKQPELQARYLRWKGKDLGQSFEDRYREIKNTKFIKPSVLNEPHLKGLDTLLYLEHHCKEYKWHPMVIGSIEQLAEESSDYDPRPYKKAHRGQPIEDLINGIMGSRQAYPEKAAQYYPILKYFVTDPDCVDEDEEYDDREFTPEERSVLHLITNTLRAGEFSYIQCDFQYWQDIKKEQFPSLLHLPDTIYNGLGYVHPWKIPQHVAFKTINPGEQTTGTFHKLVLEDTSLWYKGHYYIVS